MLENYNSLFTFQLLVAKHELLKVTVCPEKEVEKILYHFKIKKVSMALMFI